VIYHFRPFVMSQSLSVTYLHLIFSTKNREPWLADSGFRTEAHAYLAGVSAQLDCPAVIVGGVADHVHVLARFGRGITQSEWVKELKRVSSLWIKEQNHGSKKFAWQGGFGAFSVSVSALDAVHSYILNQEVHHRKVTFQEEYRAFLTKHRVTWAERYVWD
jgi:REP element-mobilizing transposase RayT